MSMLSSPRCRTFARNSIEFHVVVSCGGALPPKVSSTGALNQQPDACSISTYSKDAEWKKHLVRVALERLKAEVSIKQFQMFDLHALQGLSAKETARAVGASVMSVHMATSRLRRLLRREATSLNEAERGGP
jgi:DNA-directed RNA polymerase specialized sigma24 family protein